MMWVKLFSDGLTLIKDYSCCWGFFLGFQNVVFIPFLIIVIAMSHMVDTFTCMYVCTVHIYVSTNILPVVHLF